MKFGKHNVLNLVFSIYIYIYIYSHDYDFTFLYYDVIFEVSKLYEIGLQNGKFGQQNAYINQKIERTILFINFKTSKYIQNLKKYFNNNKEKNHPDDI